MIDSGYTTPTSNTGILSRQ